MFNGGAVMTYFLILLKIIVLILLSKVVYKQIKEQKEHRFIALLACVLAVSIIFILFASKSLGFGFPVAFSAVSAVFITTVSSFYLYNKALKVSSLRNH